MEKPAPKPPAPPSRTWVITSICTLCGNCIQVCPTKSIFLGSKQYVIDSDTCDGNALCARVCPVNAIHELNPKDPKKR
ncbi:MAG: 4Fe-4S binding protein [Bdellovibrionia bacterium]